MSEHIESDLGTAAFLLVRGVELLGLKTISPRRYGFRFADKDGIAGRTALAYMRGEAAPARELFAAEKSLKTLLYSQRDNKPAAGNGNRYGNEGNAAHRY